MTVPSSAEPPIEPFPEREINLAVAVRESWVDMAKGIAIILVVLYHSSIFLQDVGLAGPWGRAAVILDSFRMPLFFFTAGLFASRVISLDFPVLYRRRIVNLVWLYALWSVLWLLAFMVIPVSRPASGLTLIERFILLPFWPNESTWFVYALALFFGFAWILRRFPLWLQLVPAILLTLVFGSNIANTGNAALDKMGTYFIFFLLSVNVGPIVRKLVPRIHLWQAAGLLFLYAAGAFVMIRLNLSGVAGLKFIVSIVAVAAGVSCAVVLSRWRLFDWIRMLGHRTLAIYFLHFYAVLIGVAALAPSREALSPLSIALPPVLSAVAILASLGLHAVTRGVPGLYSIPNRFRGAERSIASNSG